MILRSGKSVSVVLESQIPFTMTTADASNPSVPRINFLPQPTVLRPFSGKDDQHTVQTFIAACKDVMHSSSITVTTLLMFAANKYLIP